MLIIRMMMIRKGILYPDFEKINKSAGGIFRMYFNWNTTYGRFVYYFGLIYWFLCTVALLFIANGCSNQSGNDGITAISYHCSPDGETEKSLVIEPDSIHFAVSIYSDADHYTTNEVSEKTPTGLWDRLITMCDISTFRKIKPGNLRDDEADEEFMLTTKERVMFFTNGDDSRYYKKQKNYFDTLKIISARMESKLNEKEDREID